MSEFVPCPACGRLLEAEPDPKPHRYTTEGDPQGVRVTRDPERLRAIRLIEDLWSGKVFSATSINRWIRSQPTHFWWYLHHAKAKLRRMGRIVVVYPGTADCVYGMDVGAVEHRCRQARALAGFHAAHPRFGEPCRTFDEAMVNITGRPNV